MTKETLLMLCASLCLSLCTLLSFEASAQAPRQGVRKASTGRASADSLHGTYGLLADQTEIKKKISAQRRLRDVELRREIEREALDAPSNELYGEDSWGEHVNPFAETGVNLPDSYDINLDGFVMPTDSRRVTSHYGYRPRFRRVHYGTDIGLSIGDTIRSAFSGKVRLSSYDRGGYGNFVVIRHNNGLETVYGHLHRSFVKEGTVVRAGDPIALGGNTGRSTGPHLHFEARFMGIPLNPEDLFDFQVGVPRMDVYAWTKHGRSSVMSAANASSRYASAQSKGASKIETYRVRKGDTLSEIAAKFNTTVPKLCELNGIATTAKLKPNKSLRIPN